MKISTEEETMLFQLSVIAIFGILIGVGTASWCLGFAGALAMTMFLLKQ